MCRLCYIPDARPLVEKDSILKLADLFAFLEKANGRDGNGLGAFFKKGDKKVPFIVKGVEKTTAELAEIIAKTISDPRTQPLNGWSFHTRMVSTGQKNDENCHPFTGGKYILCHNGHWAAHTDVKWPLIISGRLSIEDATGANDTRLMSTLVELFGTLVFNNINSFGVVLVNGPPLSSKVPTGADGKPLPLDSIKVPNVMIVIISDVSRDFEAVRIGTHWYYASEFPPGLKYDEHMKFEGPIAVELRDDGYTQLTHGGKIEATTGKTSWKQTSTESYNYQAPSTASGKGSGTLPSLTGNVGVARKRKWWKWPDGIWRPKPSEPSVKSEKPAPEKTEKTEKTEDKVEIIPVQ